MTRFDQYKELDDQPAPMGDRTFVGVNMRLDPALLPSGMVSDAINVRFRNGIVETRKGYIFPPWANKTTVGTIAFTDITPVGNTAVVTTASPHGLATDDVVVITGASIAEYNGTFIVTVTGPNQFSYTKASTGGPKPTGGVLNTYNTEPWGEVHGLGLFSDPFTFQEYLVIAAEGKVYYTRQGNVPILMTLPAGVTITGRVEFTQAFDVLLMHRGPDLVPLMLPRISLPWELVEQSVSGDGTETIPNSTHSLFLQNRLFIPNDNDEIAVSDLNDYTRYVPVLQEFKVNVGSADKLVGIFKFNDTTIMALKEHSIYATSNVYGDLSQMQLDELTSEFGCAARKSIAHVGNDLWFLSELGVMSITQTQQNKLQGVVLPVSDPIQPLIDRINWRYASGAAAAVWDSKYYLAVPLDDAEVFAPEKADGRRVTSTLTVVSGALYRFIVGGAGDAVVNGSETLTASADFTAKGDTVDLTNASLGASLRRVYKGQNNACLVFDFLNQAWAGYDLADGFVFREFCSTLKVDGVQRLLCVSLNGWIALMEEDYEDQIAVPFTDVVVNSSPAPGDTVNVNAAGVVTAFASANNGTAAPNDWGNGLGDRNVAASNLYSGAGAGYADWLFVHPFPTLNTNSYALGPANAALGVRFYSRNGRVPKVATTGAWGTVIEYTMQPVQALVTTRGYASQELALSYYEWLNVDVQTWAPKLSIDEATTGVNEEQAIVIDQTRDRTAYYKPGDAAPYELDNDNGDFLTPYRQDYSLLLGNSSGSAPAVTRQDYSTSLSIDIGATPDFALHTTPDGVPLDRHQEVRITERTTAYGRAALVRLTNNRGRFRVMSVSVEANEEPFSGGVKA